MTSKWSVLKIPLLLIGFLLTETKENNPHLPCWVSKTLAQKPAASPVQSKIANEAEKILATQKRDRIVGGYYINFSSLLKRIGIDEMAAVETNVFKICLDQFMRQINPKWQGLNLYQRHANIFNIEDTKSSIIRTNRVTRIRLFPFDSLACIFSLALVLKF